MTAVVVSRDDHRQSNLVPGGIAVGVLLAWLVILVATESSTDADVPFVLVLIVSASVIANFSSLRTDVDSDEVRVAFRFGWPRRAIPIPAMQECGRVRNSWWYGLGVRLIPGGMLDAVSHLDAVEVRYQTGRRRRVLRIGTDEPDRLERAIAEARGRRG